MKSKFFVLLIMAAFASEHENAENGTIESKNNENSIVVKIEEIEFVKKKYTSEYIGVTYDKRDSNWYVQRWSKSKKKNISYGSYDNEETAAHASDTLARKLMENGEQLHKLNFPDDDNEVHPEEKTAKTSEYFGVRYKESKWYVQRWSKNEKTSVSYGYYDNEEIAAHASDTLARKLMENGEHGHELNFPDDDTEVHKKTTTSKYIGVTYSKRDAMWYVQRRSKNKMKLVYYGYYDNEETAAHASDTLARKLMENGGQGNKLNFPDDHTEVQPEDYQNNKRKRQKKLQDN